MEKVKIKRVKKYHKPVSTTEKIVAGLGVGSTLLGAGFFGGAKAGDSKPFTRLTDQSQGNNSGILGDLWQNTFGMPAAKAAGFTFGADHINPATGQKDGRYILDNNGQPMGYMLDDTSQFFPISPISAQQPSSATSSGSGFFSNVFGGIKTAVNAGVSAVGTGVNAVTNQVGNLSQTQINTPGIGELDRNVATAPEMATLQRQNPNVDINSLPSATLQQFEQIQNQTAQASLNSAQQNFGSFTGQSSVTALSSNSVPAQTVPASVQTVLDQTNNFTASAPFDGGQQSTIQKVGGVLNIMTGGLIGSSQSLSGIQVLNSFPDGTKRVEFSNGQIVNVGPNGSWAQDDNGNPVNLTKDQLSAISVAQVTDPNVQQVPNLADANNQSGFSSAQAAVAIGDLDRNVATSQDPTVLSSQGASGQAPNASNSQPPSLTSTVTNTVTDAASAVGSAAKGLVTSPISTFKSIFGIKSTFAQPTQTFIPPTISTPALPIPSIPTPPNLAVDTPVVPNSVQTVLDQTNNFTVAPPPPAGLNTVNPSSTSVNSSGFDSDGISSLPPAATTLPPGLTLVVGMDGQPLYTATPQQAYQAPTTDTFVPVQTVSSPSPSGQFVNGQFVPNASPGVSQTPTTPSVMAPVDTSSTDSSSQSDTPSTDSSATNSDNTDFTGPSELSTGDNLGGGDSFSGGGGGGGGGGGYTPKIEDDGTFNSD